MKSFRADIISTLIAVSLSLVSVAGHAGDLFDMLKHMSEAELNKNYQGTFILRKSDELSTLRVTHGMGEDGEWESLEALSGEPQKVVRLNNRIVTIFPSRNLVTVRHTDKAHSLHQQLPMNTDQLESFYKIDQLDDDRIANRQTLVIALSPKDEYRYGYRYWIDKTTGMLLRCDLMSEDGAAVEQMMFTSLEYLPVSPPKVLELEQFDELDDKVLNAPEAAIELQQNNQAKWKVNRLPEGFMLTQSTMRHSLTDTAGEHNALQKVSPDLQHLVYSDGLASVSVFIEKNQGLGRHLQGASSKGAVNAFGTPMGVYYVTVVGEVPVKTVQSMAQSITRIE